MLQLHIGTPSTFSVEHTPGATPKWNQTTSTSDTWTATVENETCSRKRLCFCSCPLYILLRIFVCIADSLQNPVKVISLMTYLFFSGPFDNTDTVYLEILQTIYRKLTNSVYDCPRYGNHWEKIGFQGTKGAWN